MASDLNKWIGIGRLTRDPELKYLQSGASVTSFSIAVNYSYKSNGEKKEIVSFFNCTAWGKLGEEVINKYAHKGDRIGVEGRLQQRSWDDLDGKKRTAIDIIVDTVQLLGVKQKSVDDELTNIPEPGAPVSDEDIPF